MENWLGQDLVRHWLAESNFIIALEQNWKLRSDNAARSQVYLKLVILLSAKYEISFIKPSNELIVYQVILAVVVRI